MFWRPVYLLAHLLLVCQALGHLQAAEPGEIEDILKDEVVLEERDLHHRKRLTTNDLNVLEKVIDELLLHKRDEPDYSNEESAKNWLEELNAGLYAKYRKLTVATFNYLTNLTQENELLYTQISLETDQWSKPQIDTARKFLTNKDSFQNATVVRLLERFVNAQLIPVSSDPNVLKKLNTLTATMEGIYSKGKVSSKDNGKPLPLDPDLTLIMAKSRDYDELEYYWKCWRDAVGPALKPDFEELVRNMNTAAKEYGMPDVGMAWRLIDYEDNNIGEAFEELWTQVKPLYEELHAYVRRKLIEQYPNRGIEKNGPIPAHLLGNMWAQEWLNILDIALPYPDAPTHNFDEKLKASYNATGLFKLAEGFFMSLGLEPMTQTFWDKSMIVKPTDGREVVCHAAADTLFAPGDFRIKMCTKVDMEDFETIHHEMGHIEYFMQYRNQPMIFQEGANAAFHEAIGDTIALSAMTPAHLVTVGLLDKDQVSDDSNHISESDINFLLQQAFKKMAFLPFGYLMDLWRWDVFSGKIKPSEYNKHWWQLRLKYQGMVPPVERTEDDFDPGAKYHIATNVPYLRYFGSHLAQFQFLKAMCDAKKHKGPLFKCDFYQSKEAGDLLKSMLQLGSSKPWPDTMEIVTGQRSFNAEPILEYFDPLMKWLRKENKKNNDKPGWKS